ncbi:MULTISPECIES: winged helix-turn-helix transcriptional regulator [Streptomyces]|uniref:winged helix-turn-helix transcriptional regulator n=1 Tax=Streptomyces TaxID=1883 RepID=UPI00099D7BAB|nr:MULTISPECIES: winged helix-turn-helix transcriptional regulator [Streptomyces]
MTETSAHLPGVLRDCPDITETGHAPPTRRPPRVEYRLTPLGEQLRDVLEAMATWAQAVPGPEPDVTV